MKYFVVFDTNVIVSALLKRYFVPWKVLEEALLGRIIPVVNEKIIAEDEEVLLRPKFSFDGRTVRAFLEDFERRAVYSADGETDITFTDSSDKVFYTTLMEIQKVEDAYLVTGNMRHFPLRTMIVTPREMLDILDHGLDYGYYFEKGQTMFTKDFMKDGRPGMGPLPDEEPDNP